MGPEKMERRTRTRPRNVDQRSGMAPRRVVDRRTSQFLSRLFSQVSRKRVCFLFFSPYILSFSLEIDLVVSSSFTNEIVSGTRKNGIFTIGLCVDTRPDWITRTTATFSCRSRLCLSLCVYVWWPASVRSPLYILVAYTILLLPVFCNYSDTGAK